MKKRSKILCLLICILAALCCFTAVAFVSADDPVTVKVVSYPSEFQNGVTTIGFKFDQKVGGNDILNLEGRTLGGKKVSDYLYHNDEPNNPSNINMHYCSQTVTIHKNGDSFKIGDTLEMLAGFPLPEQDGTTEAASVAQSVKLIYTVNGWIRTAEYRLPKERQTRRPNSTAGSLPMRSWAERRFPFPVRPSIASGITTTYRTGRISVML